MRELKFRAWDPYKKRMDYCCEVLTIWNGVMVPEGDHIPMQYTGLKDKNGKEIYEGDVMSYQSSPSYEVIFQSPRFCFRVKSEDGTATLSMVDGARIMEVIGNIHETPDLIK